MSDSSTLRPPTSADPTPHMRDALIASARNIPDLIAKAQTADPQLAEQLIGKSLFASKSPPAIALAAVLTWASTKYGLGWDSSTVDTITLVVGVVAAYGMRYLTHTPITSLVVPPAAPPVPSPSLVPSIPPVPVTVVGAPVVASGIYAQAPPDTSLWNTVPQLPTKGS